MKWKWRSRRECASKFLLDQFVQGFLDEGTAAQIAAHVSNCRRCGKAVSRSRVNDGLLGGLRTARDARAASAKDVQRIALRVKSRLASESAFDLRSTDAMDGTAK